MKLNPVWGLFSPLVLLIGTNQVYAQASSLPQTFQLTNCLASGAGQTRCSFPTVASLSSVTQPFSMRWDIDYSFPCRGHRHGIAFTTREGNHNVAFENTSRTVVIQGTGPLELKDIDAEATRRATFVGSCAVTIHSIIGAPAMDVMLGWRTEAQSLVDNIRDARDGMLLAESFSSLASILSGDVKGLSTATWSMMNQVLIDLNTLGTATLPLGICEFTDASCTRLLSRDQMTPEQRDKLDIVLIESPHFADYHRLYAHINALPVIISGQEKGLEEVFGILRVDLVKFFRTKLERQRNAGRRLLEKTQPFAASFEDDLKKSIQELSDLVKGSST